MTSLALAHAPDSEPSLEQLEDEIATLSATIQAATYRFLCLVEAFDRRSGWADPLDSNGFRSCAHWLSYRVGLDLGTARQHVRVARALPGLPRISEAFGQGRLSYSKVRAITRIATPKNEDLLLDWALAGTASHVERLVRRYRLAIRAQENDRARLQQDERRLQVHWDDEGMLVVRGRLAPEQGALLMKALEAARDVLDTEQDGSAEPSSDSQGQRQADALARVAERSLVADAADAPQASGDRFQVVVHVDAEVLADPDADGRCELEDGPTIAPQTARRIACDGAVSEVRHGPDGALVPGRKTRAISAPLRRALRARDGTRCAFPGCSCRGLDAHHVQHWSNGGPTTLANLLSLCRFHHRLAHEGGFRVEARPGGRFRFYRPDGTELLATPPAPTRSDALPPALSGAPTWQGESCDYDWMVQTLEWRATAAVPRRRGTRP